MALIWVQAVVDFASPTAGEWASGEIDEIDDTYANPLITAGYLIPYVGPIPPSDGAHISGYSANIIALINAHTGTTTGAHGLPDPTTLVVDSDSRLIDPSDVGYDVIIAAGQSNMWGQTGCTPDPDRLDPSDSRIWQYAQSGDVDYVDTISVAVDPLSHPETSGYGAPAGMGPALVFARWYAGAVPHNRRVLIVPMAVGGTEIGKAAEWDPHGAAGNYYFDTIAKTNAAITAAGANARVVCMLWLQGESDAIANYPASSYQAKLDALIAGWRAAVTGATSCPFVVLGMVPEFVTGTAAAIRAVHVDTPNRVSYAGFAAGPAGSNLGDDLHYTADAQRHLGRSALTAYQSALTNVVAQAVPGAVAGLAATFYGPDVIALSWIPATADPAVTDYTVQYKRTADANWSTYADGTSTTASATLQGLDPATAYDVRVAAVNSMGQGSYSATVSATTTTPIIQDAMAGAVGTDLTAHAPDIGDAWSRVAGTATLTLNGSGAAVFGNGGASATIWRSATVPGSADYSARLDLDPISIADAEIGPTVRTGADGNNRIVACLVATQLRMIQRNGGSNTTLATKSVAGLVSVNDVYRITITAVGTAVTAQFMRLSDGLYLTTSNTWQAAPANVMTGTATLADAGAPGIFGAVASNDGATIDNYYAW